MHSLKNMEILSALIGFFKFFDQVSAFIKLLQKTPASRHQELLKEMQARLIGAKNGDRPEWD